MPDNSIPSKVYLAIGALVEVTIEVMVYQFQRQQIYLLAFADINGYLQG